MIAHVFEHFSFPFYYNNAQYFAKMTQHFKPATDLNFIISTKSVVQQV